MVTGSEPQNEITVIPVSEFTEHWPALLTATIGLLLLHEPI